MSSESPNKDRRRRDGSGCPQLSQGDRKQVRLGSGTALVLAFNAFIKGDVTMEQGQQNTRNANDGGGGTGSAEEQLQGCSAQ